ncbi:MAG TPA: Ig-like domain-containing protein, partial [Acidimicrobiales bacterium]
MPYMHKLSCRLALLKDALIVVSLTAVACELPVRTTGPAGDTYLTVVPKTVTIQPSDTVDLMAVGYTSSGDTANIPVSWSMTAGSLVDSTTKGWRHYAKIKAGSGTGTFKVVAHGNQTTATDTATVTVAQLPVASVLVTPAVVSVLIGAGVQLTATPQDASGSPLSGRVVNWSTTNVAVATVNSSGVVTGVAAGAATVTATSEGQNGTSAVTVSTVPVASVSVSPASASLQTGQTVQLTATPKDASGNPLSGRVVNWSTSSAAVATVSSSGLVTGGSAGSATITATSEGQSATSAIGVTSVPVASVSVSPAS